MSPGQDALRTGHWDGIGLRCCRDSPVGSPDGAGGSGGSGAVADECNECLASSCPTDDAACLANDACISMFDCMASCFDQACVTACETTHANGVTAYKNLTSCFVGSCSELCA